MAQPTPQHLPASPPAAGAAAPRAQAPVVLSWPAQPDARGYWLEISRDPQFREVAQDFLVGRGASATLPPELASAPGPLYWRVKAQQADGWGPYGAAQPVAAAASAPAAPASAPAAPKRPDYSRRGSYPLRPSGGAPTDAGMLELEWRPAPGAQRYHVQIARDEAFAQRVFDAPVGRAADLTLYDMLPEDKKTYYWRVRSEGPQGWEDWSQAAAFTAASHRDVDSYRQRLERETMQEQQRERAEQGNVEAAIDAVGGDFTSPREVTYTLAVMLTTFFIMLALSFILGAAV